MSESHKPVPYPSEYSRNTYRGPDAPDNSIAQPIDTGIDVSDLSSKTDELLNYLGIINWQNEEALDTVYNHYSQDVVDAANFVLFEDPDSL